MFKLNYIDKYFATIFICWLFLWVSLGILPNNLNNEIMTYLDLINYLRVYVPIFCAFSLFLIICFKYVSFFSLYKKENSTIINLFIIYFLTQVLGLLQNNSLQFNIENLYLVIVSICAIEILIINQFLNTDKNLQYLLFSGIIICIISSSYFFFSSFINHPFYFLQEFFNVKLRGYYDMQLDKVFFLEKTVLPRSTGVARTFGLINIFIILYLIFINKKKSLFIYLISICYTSLVWLFQSRGSFLIFFLITILIIYLTKKLNLKRKIYAIFYLIIFPIILTESLMFLGKKLISKNYFDSNIKYEILKNEDQINKNFEIRLFTDYSTSGRTQIWNESLRLFEKNKLFGYGPQGDRFILNSSEVANKFYNNTSNALIYSLLSGGYFGFLVMCSIYLNIILKIYILFKKLKIFNYSKDITLKLTVCYILFFLFRSFFENSFSLFGIDFMIFILSAVYLENFLKRMSRL